MGRDNSFSMFMAGDAIISRPWSQIEDDRFGLLVERMRSADATIVNLEMLLHEYNGFPQPDILYHLGAPPQIAHELTWAGVDMVGHANNHTNDYGAIGILETVENVEKAGLILAGSGKDLQRARSPAYFKTDKGVVALVAATATHKDYAFASPSRQDMHGRPGPNPLTGLNLQRRRLPGLLGKAAHRLERLARSPGKQFYDRCLSLTGSGSSAIPPRVSRHTDPKQLSGNVAAVREAREKADLVVFSLHTHDGGWWREDLAHYFIDAGVDIFFVQGPHDIRGIEIYKGKPIFYCMGNFVNHLEWIDRHPIEFFESLGLSFNAPMEEGLAAKHAQRQRKKHRELEFQGFGTVLDFDGWRLKRIQILPLDLGPGRSSDDRGFPYLATGARAREIVNHVAWLSGHYGVDLRFDEATGTGIVELPA